jgi:DNA modification methylase
LARSIDILKKTYSYTGEEVAIKTGISPERQSQLLKLLTLDASVQEKVQAKKLTAAHGNAIAGLSNPEEQKNLADRAVKKKYSVKQLNEKVRQLKSKESQAKDDENERPDLGAELPKDVPGVYFKSSANMSEILDGEVHLILSSPPYGLGKEFEEGHTPETIFDENKTVLDECVKKLCPGGFLVLNLMDFPNCSKGRGKNKYQEWFYAGVKYQNYLRPLGVHLRDVLQWWKKNLNWAYCTQMFPVEKVPHTAYRFSNQTEQILIFQKDGVREELPSKEIQARSHLTDQQFREYGKNIWEINIARIEQEHPCVYPEALCERVIRMFSFEGDTVLDPWLGSGTTVKVARELNRVGIGYERELKYKPLILKKLGLQPAAQQDAPATGSMMAYAEEMLKGTCSDTATESSAETIVCANDKFAQETPTEHPLCESVQSIEDFIAAESLFHSPPAATVSASPAA